jgi:hypothetical protein
VCIIHQLFGLMSDVWYTICLSASEMPILKYWHSNICPWCMLIVYKLFLLQFVEGKNNSCMSWHFGDKSETEVLKLQMYVMTFQCQLSMQVYWLNLLLHISEYFCAFGWTHFLLLHLAVTLVDQWILRNGAWILMFPFYCVNTLSYQCQSYYFILEKNHIPRSISFFYFFCLSKSKTLKFQTSVIQSLLC